jgi:hypothetical protein
MELAAGDRVEYISEPWSSLRHGIVGLGGWT